jgi:hypothetical protein
MGGGSTGTQTAQTKEKLSPQQEKLMDLAWKTMRPYTHGDLPEGYQGSTIPDLNKTQQQANKTLLGAADQQADFFKSLIGAQQGMFSKDFLDISKNPNTQAAMNAAAQPITEQLMETVMPRIDAESITAGGFGGSRQGVAQGNAVGEAAEAIGNLTGRMGSDLYGQNLSAQSRAMAMAPQTMQMATLPGQTLGAVGDRQWSMDAARAQEAKDAYMLQQFLPLQMGQAFAGMASGIPGGMQISQTPGTTTSPWQSILGGASAGAGVGGPWGAAAGGGLGALMAFL